jgi:hypothetical protein
MNHGEVYCRCCGQKCKPIKTMQPTEDYQGLVEELVSDCCGDALSQVPVTDQCARCGAVAERGESFPETPEGEAVCLRCLADYGADKEPEGA